MKQNTKLIFLGILSSTLLLGCAASKINFSLNPNETDAIKFANETRLAYDEANAGDIANLKSLIDSLGGSNKSNISNFVEEYVDRRQVDVDWQPIVPMLQNNAPQLTADLINAQFKRICTNNAGFFSNGWCVKPKTEVPLFWAKAQDRYWKVRTQYNTRTYHAISMAVYAPVNTEADASWLKFVNEQGYRTLAQRQADSKFLLSSKGRGATVCSKQYGKGVHPGDAIVERGYVEDSNNGKIKVRIVARGEQEAGVVESGRALSDTVRTRTEKEVNVWAEPGNWFICR